MALYFFFFCLALMSISRREDNVEAEQGDPGMDSQGGYKKTPHLFTLTCVFSVGQIKNNFKLSIYHGFASTALTQHIFITVTAWDITMVWYLSIYQSSHERWHNTILSTRCCPQSCHRDTKFSFNCTKFSLNLLQLIYLSKSYCGIILRMLPFLIL